MSLNPLATPKGVKVLCELCQRPAYVQCTRCRVTYYCGESHQSEDWDAIHERICEVVMVLRGPLPHDSTQEERLHTKQQQMHRKKYIIDVALQEGKRFLHAGQPNRAIPAALGALRFLREVYGSSHIELTPAYLILAEAAIGLGRLTEADQYLSQAQWSVLKASGCDPWLRAQLHRNLGMLASSKGQFAEARKHFAEDIYQSSVAYSPDATQTSGGYYHLGQVFLKEKKHDIAISLHDQVIMIWQQNLHQMVEDVSTKTQQDQSLPVQGLDAAQEAEACHMLHSIRELRERSSPHLTVEVYHTLAMLHYVLRDHTKCEMYARRAMKLMPQDSSPTSTSQSLERLLQLTAKTVTQT